MLVCVEDQIPERKKCNKILDSITRPNHGNIIQLVSAMMHIHHRTVKSAEIKLKCRFNPIIRQHLAEPLSGLCDR